MVTTTRLRERRGFSLIELLFVLGLMGVIAAIAVPMMANSLGFFRLSGDARSVANMVALSKMRAASVFGRVRVFVDQPAKTFRIESWDSTSNTWVADSGGTSHLSQGVRFDFAPVATAPPNTQAVIREASACKDNAGNNIGNTACVVFNSRGVPIDSTGASTSLDAPLHALCPLHELPPTHLTCAVVADELSAARAVLPMKASATAVAIIAPVIFVLVMTCLLLDSW